MVIKPNENHFCAGEAVCIYSQSELIQTQQCRRVLGRVKIQGSSLDPATTQLPN